MAVARRLIPRSPRALRSPRAVRARLARLFVPLGDNGGPAKNGTPSTRLGRAPR